MDQQTSNYRILLIEEDPKQVEIYGDLIRAVADCKVDVLSPSEEIYEWIGKSGYQLVVIDPLPTTRGLALLEQIKRVSPVTSVIMISDRASVEEAVAAIRLGAEDYLAKPFQLEAFQLAVKRGLDKKVVYEGETAFAFLNLFNSCQMISASLDQKNIFEVLQSYLGRELSSNHRAIFKIENGTPARVSETENGPDRGVEEVLDIAFKTSNVAGLFNDPETIYHFIDRGNLTPGMFVFKFRCADDFDYFCVCLSPEQPQSLNVFESQLRMLKAQIELTGRNITKYQGVQHLVYLDDATGLYNTRYLNQILDREIAQTEANNKPFAVVFMDADRFKKVNDKHGHLIGTKLLNELGAHLKKLVRDTDSVFRYGGDEFIAVLSPCDLSTAKTVAERIRQSVESHVFLTAEGLKLKMTVSLGVAVFPDHAASKKEIIDAADHALYKAKNTHRNSVSIAISEVKKDGTRG